MGLQGEQLSAALIVVKQRRDERRDLFRDMRQIEAPCLAEGEPAVQEKLDELQEDTYLLGLLRGWQLARQVAL